MCCACTFLVFQLVFAVSGATTAVLACMSVFVCIHGVRVLMVSTLLISGRCVPAERLWRREAAVGAWVALRGARVGGRVGGRLGVLGECRPLSIQAL